MQILFNLEGVSGGGREGQSLRNILIKLEGEDPRQKGFHYFFLNWKEWRGIQTNKNQNKKGSSKKKWGQKRERDNYK